MDFSSIAYTLIAVIIFFLLLLVLSKKLSSPQFNLSKLNILAYSFILGGLFFGEAKLLAYCLVIIGVGIAFYGTWKARRN